ncbi:MAG: MFS transporter [Candidatus Limiplasma sp.]|nr:MFS transporter [Candidatus Limiplasma sp.]
MDAPRRPRLTAPIALVLCWLVYVAAYLARAGISAGYEQLAAHFGTDGAYLGIVGSAFFAAYAVGQLINGFWGDRLRPESFIAASMLGSACVYGLALLLDSATALPVLWAGNGIFLSMLWGPMLRLLCIRFGQARKAKLAMVMGAAPVGGYCLAWLVLAPRMPALGWRAVFAVPLALTLALLACWLLLMRAGADPSALGADWSRKRHTLRDTYRYVSAHKLWPLALTSLCLGLVKENLALLLPALFLGFLGTSVGSGSWLLLLSPLANLTGLLAGWSLARPLTARPASSLAYTFLAMALMCGLLAFTLGNRTAAFAALFLLAALAYLGSCIQISYLPLSHADENMISTLVGLFDFANYVGAAAASIVLGALMAAEQWRAVSLIWLGVCAFASLCAFGKARRKAAGK